jgi:alpha-tubulin suppressor-like RCC1 family protein
VGKNAKTKGVPMAAVLDVLPGRDSEVFRKWSSLEIEHPPEVCLSVRYEEEGARDLKKKTVPRFRTLDLVFEDPARLAVWRAGIAAASRRARANSATDPDAAPEKSSDGSHARDPRNARDANADDAMSARQTMATAMRVSTAASRFKRLGSGAAAAARDVSRNTNRDVIAEPGDVFVWGRVAAVDGGGAFGAFGNADNAETSDARSKETAAATPRRVAGTDGIDVVNVALGASHVAAVARGRGVYTWGEGRGGRLGHGSHASRALPTKLRGVVVEAAGLGGDGDGDGDDVQVCCGGSVTFAVSGDGRCSAWGDAQGQSASVFGTGTDSRGANGYGGSAFGSASRWTPVPVLLPGLESGARRVVKSVSASRSHVAALAADGALFTWGENYFGALGVGRSELELTETSTSSSFAGEDARATPTLVEALIGKRVTSVSCGRWHTAAVADGEVFAWGDAEGGKLGLGAPPGSSSGGGEKKYARSVFTPARVAGNAFSAPPAHVSCGTWHTLCLTEDGALYVCGAVGGRDVAGSVAETPTRVAFAAEDDARDGVPPSDARFNARLSRACLLVASGELHAAAVVAANAKGGLRDVAGVYTWGSGKRGALGHGELLPQKFPKRVAALAGRDARRVSCGPDATACVVSPRLATNREKASVAKAGSKLTRRFDASARSGMDLRERLSSSYASADRAGFASSVDGASNAVARRSSAAELGSLSRVSGASARSSETREGSVRSGDGRFAGRESDRVFLGVLERGNEGSAKAEAGRRGSFTFATTRPIGAGTKSSDASLADADADAARAAAARARRDAASAAAERDALRLEVASLRAALRLAERAGDVNAPRPPAPEPADPEPAPAAALAAAAREEAETLAAFARGGDRDDPTPLAAATRVTTPAATRVTTPAATRVTTPAATRVTTPAATRVTTPAATQVTTPAATQVTTPAATQVTTPAATQVTTPAPPVAATATPASLTPRTPQTDAGTPDVGTPETAARASGRGESRRLAPSPSPSPSPSPNPATPGSSSGTPGSQWVEEIEPGVFMTIACDAATGHHVLRRVRFSKRVFSDTEATAWWTKNRARVIRGRGLKVNR